MLPLQVVQYLIDAKKVVPENVEDADAFYAAFKAYMKKRCAACPCMARGRGCSLTTCALFPFDYCCCRRIHKPGSRPVFPSTYGPDERDKFYMTVARSGEGLRHSQYHLAASIALGPVGFLPCFVAAGWPGACGDDSVIIAYDALLYSNGDWGKLMEAGMFHGGDSDSTGACCFPLFVWFACCLSALATPHWVFLLRRSHCWRLVWSVVWLPGNSRRLR